jgi:Tol biopolymer transport system component
LLAGTTLIWSLLSASSATAQAPGLQGCALLIPDSKRIENSELFAPQLSLDGKFVAYEKLDGDRRELHISETGAWERHQVKPKPGDLFKAKQGYESELDWFPIQGSQSRFVFVTGEKDNLDIYLGDAAEPSKPSIPLVTWDSNDEQPALSPDGKDLVFVSTKGRKEGADLYVILDVDKKLRDPAADLAPVRLTTSATGVLYPAWSPDGKFVSLTIEETENDVLNDGVSVLPFGKLRPSLKAGDDASAKVTLQRVTSPEVWPDFVRHDEVGASWSPDGSFLAFYMSAHTGGRKAKKEGEKVEQSLGLVQVKSLGDELKFSAVDKTPFLDKALDPNVDSFLRGPVWSPDSKWILVVKDSAQEENPIRIVGVPGGELREEKGTILNRDLFVVRGNGGATTVLFSAQDRQTTSVYRCELR